MKFELGSSGARATLTLVNRPEPKRKGATLEVPNAHNLLNNTLFKSNGTMIVTNTAPMASFIRTQY